MVRGTKRKLPMEKIQKKESRAVSYTKRREGLYSKASQLCLLSGGQMAIIATPPSSESNVSFYCFGHSSVDAVVTGQRLAPVRDKDMREDVGVCLARKDVGLGFWWEDKTLVNSENLEQLMEARDSMLKLMTDIEKLHSEEENNNHNHEDAKKKKKDALLQQTLDEIVVSHQTLDLIPSNFNYNITEEQSICDNNALLAENLDDNNQEMDLDNLIDFDMDFKEFENFMAHSEIGDVEAYNDDQRHDQDLETSNVAPYYGTDQEPDPHSTSAICCNIPDDDDWLKNTVTEIEDFMANSEIGDDDSVAYNDDQYEEDVKASNVVSYHEPDQSTSTICCIDDDDCLKRAVTEIEDYFTNNNTEEEHDQILSFCQSFCNNVLPAQDQDMDPSFSFCFNDITAL